MPAFLSRPDVADSFMRESHTATFMPSPAAGKAAFGWPGGRNFQGAVARSSDYPSVVDRLVVEPVEVDGAGRRVHADDPAGEATGHLGRQVPAVEGGEPGDGTL